MSAKGCDLCGENVDVHDGGAVLMFTFCRWNSVTLTNVAFCSKCYKRLMDKDLRRLNENCNLRIDFGMPLQEPPKGVE